MIYDNECHVDDGQSRYYNRAGQGSVRSNQQGMTMTMNSTSARQTQAWNEHSWIPFYRGK